MHAAADTLGEHRTLLHTRLAVPVSSMFIVWGAGLLEPSVPAAGLESESNVLFISAEMFLHTVKASPISVSALYCKDVRKLGLAGWSKKSTVEWFNLGLAG